MRLARAAMLTMVALACASGGTNAGSPPAAASPATNAAPSATPSSPPALAAVPAAGTATSERVSRATLRHAIDSMVAQSEFRNSHFGVLIVDPERGDTLYSLNAGKLFMPASNMKIVTGATSLVQLGPDYTYRTAFATTGTVRRDTLHGQLVVMGSGDPSISDHMQGSAMTPLYAIADSLKARGIKAITGG